MNEETLDSDFVHQSVNEATSPKDVLLNYNFEIKVNREIELDLFRMTWKAQNDIDKKSVGFLVILGFIIGGIGSLQPSKEPSGYFMVGAATVLFLLATIIAYQNYKARKINKDFANKRIEDSLSVGTYSVILNEDFFGQDDYWGSYRFNWSKEICIVVTTDHLNFKLNENQVGYHLTLSKVYIGEEKFQEVIKAVQNKLKRVRAIQNNKEEDEDIFRKR